MKYKELSKIYYAHKGEYEQEYNMRKNSWASIDLNMKIGKWEGFYVNIPEISTGISELYAEFTKLQELCNVLPHVAYDRYARNCLIDEVMLTNDIEGIRSTRREIIDILASVDKDDKKRRFDGLVKKYFLLLDEDDISLSLMECQDIRDLYDDIVSDEIDPQDLPDGEIFRKNGVDVVSGTQQVKHRGVNPEEKIIEYMEECLKLLHRKDIPEICKIALFHYMVGYVHPFYDGNGRLSRFISSCMLKNSFNSLVALRLSYMIKENKSEYYKAFDICNNTLNRGDLTFFILHFISIIQKAVGSLNERLSDGAAAIKHFWNLIEARFPSEDDKKNKAYHDILWFMVQNALFAGEYFDKDYLALLMNVNKATSHKYVKSMIEDGIPLRIEQEGKKSIYVIDLQKLDEYLSE